MTQPPYGFDFQTESVTGPISTPDGQTFDEYRWSQLVEENKRLIAVSKALKDRLDSLEARFEAVRDTVGAVNGRLAELEGKDQPTAKPVDEINEKIVAFLESVPDVKLTAIAIRENLDIPAKYIHDRCKTLVRNNRIRTFVEPNRHPFYQALPKAEPAVDSPA